MMPLLKHFVRFQLPALLWAGTIYYASSIPSSRLPKIAFLINDKIIHASIFFILGLLVYRALEPRVKPAGSQWKRFFIAVLAVVIYGFVDEFHQSFVPGRDVDIKDATADAVGGIISAAVVYLRSLKKQRTV